VHDPEGAGQIHFSSLISREQRTPVFLAARRAPGVHRAASIAIQRARLPEELTICILFDLETQRSDERQVFPFDLDSRMQHAGAA
jgi:hypothetical protein